MDDVQMFAMNKTELQRITICSQDIRIKFGI